MENLSKFCNCIVIYDSHRTIREIIRVENENADHIKSTVDDELESNFK